jgi:hypothetical protein
VVEKAAPSVEERHRTVAEYQARQRRRAPCRRKAKDVRGRQVPFLRATLEDIELANRLAPELLGRSLDEPPPQTRRVYEVPSAQATGTDYRIRVTSTSASSYKDASDATFRIN